MFIQNIIIVFPSKCSPNQRCRDLPTSLKHDCGEVTTVTRHRPLISSSGPNSVRVIPGKTGIQNYTAKIDHIRTTLVCLLLMRPYATFVEKGEWGIMMYRLPEKLNRLYQIAAQSAATVLITGPTGTGKTSLARRIHETGPRRNKPFVVINLASLHEGTLESELFGHERGAFTSADQKRTGKLELANGGTVFLDEIGELSPRLQARLLEFLQSKAICPVGSNREMKLDVRVIAATHQDLEASVRAGTFRADLFHRLRVLSLAVPSLQERNEEFDVLVHSLLEELCKQAGRVVLRISESVAQMIESYPWPGNIRELKNVLEFAVLASDGPEITLGDLPDWFKNPLRLSDVSSSGLAAADSLQPASPNVRGGILATIEVPLTEDFHQTVANFEREYLRWALKRCRGKINRTARSIQVNKTTLLRRIEQHQLRSEIATLYGGH